MVQFRIIWMQAYIYVPVSGGLRVGGLRDRIRVTSLLLMMPSASEVPMEMSNVRLKHVM